MKLAASTTEITQACDQIFIAPKTRLRTITDDSIRYNEGMIGSIINLLKTHVAVVPKQHRVAMKYKVIAYGLLRVQRALQLTYTTQSVQKSFSEVGMYDCTTNSYDLLKVLKQCKTKFEPDETLSVVTRIGSLGRKIGKNGELFESDFDLVGVEASVPSKDSKVLNQRRVVFLTNRELVGRETSKLIDKDLKAEHLEQKRIERKDKKDKAAAEALSKSREPLTLNRLV